MPPTSDPSSPRFQGGVRHYHRHSTPASRSWDDWVGDKPKTRSTPRFIARIGGILLAFAGLAAIVIGLIVEMF